MPHPIPSAPHSFPSAPRPGPRLPRARRVLARSLAGASLVVLPFGLAAGCYKNVDLTEGSGVRTLTCWGDPSADNTVAKCVIFARADAPDSPGDGTREHPFTSLQTAVDAAKSSKKRVFACGSAPFEEPLSIEAPVELWGGFDCGTWHYSETARASLVGPPDLPALTFTPNGSGALVVSLSITAPPSDLTGGSSVGVVVDNVYSQTFLWRCDITVGDGKDGKDGDPPVEPAEGGTDAAFSGQAGAPTDACVPVASVEGGDPGALDCEDGKSLGGKGGFGGTAPNGTGQDGSDGMPLPQDNPMLYGVGGLGQSESADCTVGVPGAPGVIGPPGDGAQTKGALTMQGIAPVHGKGGSHGARGGGGGGGGGARAGVFCPSGNMTIVGPGASGGGGGAGGCGGKGGNGGRAGGSSIGVVSLGGELVLNQGTITVGKGGKGGAGGAGQPGGPGGKGAEGGAASGSGVSITGCAGGDGGPGGPGGPGGGGRGGHAVGVAYTKTAPITNDLAVIPGAPGKGGFGGPGHEMEGKGADGKQVEMGEFSGF